MLVRVVDFDLKLKIFVELAVVRVNRNLRSSLNKRKNGLHVNFEQIGDNLIVWNDKKQISQ